MKPDSERLPEAIIRAAIEWQMQLRIDGQSAKLLKQLDDWLQRDTRHQLAWQRLQQMESLFHDTQLPAAAHAIPLLQHAEADLGRRRTVKLLGLGIATGSAALLAPTVMPGWRADLVTSVGERRRLELGDGAEVMLNTGSALDHGGDELILRAGEVMVDGEEWRLLCRFARCEGRQARMHVRERDGLSEIRVERGEVFVTAASGRRVMHAGEALSVSTRGMTPLGRGAIDPFAWTRGLLVASDIRLDDFLTEAGRYRQGWLGCDPAVAEIRLSGVFRLDEPDLMLRNITHLLPVQIVERTRWWVRVVPVA
ncbi:DUF4880 domain-containing protein [Stutzerimonas stutzeri]|uniref:DUF4880 domain-containing protein n=1 Tax=Stutzerimonas stutzeri TaxID=316 RepID=UPI00210D8BEC|nr:DUF4880 domain-containing protein [Stutzerimonas stutzeri]